MTPMDVETLFDAEPGLFAYMLPTRAERTCIASGDLVKLFFQLEDFKHPKPIWMTVTAVDETDADDCSYTGVLANMKYGPTIKSHFVKPVKFNVRHLYRVPLNRPQIENPEFNDELRS